MGVESKGSVTWSGDLATGRGEVSLESGALSGAAVSWAKRSEDRSSGTSPEELIAGAHASCYAMAFSARLAKNGTPPQRLEVGATVTFAKGDAGFAITSSALRVKATVPGIDAATFQRLAADAKDGCPVSQALKGNVALSVEASLTA